MRKKWLKNKLYDFFVKKNGRVCYEYERYVREHIQEHHLHRFEHIKLLIKLNWFYRVKKGNTPYIYWDVPLDPNERITNPEVQKKQLTQGWKSNAFLGSESKSYSSWKEVHLVKRFLEYEYIVFDVFDTLLYLGIREKKNFYRILEKEFHISHFSEMRERAEQEAINKAKLKGKEVTIENIYEQLRKYTRIDIGEGVKTEIAVLKRIAYANPYMKTFYDMLSYNMNHIIAVQNTYYTSEQIKDILVDKGYSGIQNVYVSNEICAIKDKGNILSHISAKLMSEKIIYMGSDKKKNSLAREIGWEIWEYRNANECGNRYRPCGLSGIATDAYCAITNQHMYCGHYQHSQRRELGYSYFGILAIGFLNWIKEKCRKEGITKIEFINGTCGILKDNYDRYFKEKVIVTDTLNFSEEIAVRCLVDIEPTCFFEYYIDRKINGEYTVSFYIERMRLQGMKDRLAEYGINPTDVMKLNGNVYWSFLDFIGDNLNEIKAQYEDEIQAVCQYLMSKNYENEKIGIVDVRGRGYIVKALNWLLNNRLNIKCNVKELTAFQVMPFEDVAYLDGTISAFLTSKKIIEGFNLPINIGQGNYFESVFSDKMPRLCSFYLNETKQYQMEFGDAYPWRYDAIAEIQKGIKDFILDYMSVWKNDISMCSFSAEDILLVLRNITTNSSYLKDNIPIVLV